MAGTNLHVVSKNLGHSRTSITRRYGHLALHFRREESQKIAAFWKRGTRRVHEKAKSVKP